MDADLGKKLHRSLIFTPSAPKSNSAKTNPPGEKIIATKDD
jgi:hypothetical protein